MDKKFHDRLLTLSKKYSFNDIKDEYGRLTKAYKSHHNITITSELEAIAYALIRMPATSTVLSQVLSHLKFASSRINTLLDLGCGPGTILTSLEENLLPSQITLVDRSPSLLKLGQHIFVGHNNPEIQWEVGSLTNLKLFQSYDVVTISYVLNELSPIEQLNLIQHSWQACQQFMVLVEPGTPVGFKHILQARQLLMKLGATITAPCTHNFKCPMAGFNPELDDDAKVPKNLPSQRDMLQRALKGLNHPSSREALKHPNILDKSHSLDWCHFKARVDRSEIHRLLKGYLPYEDEKYSFLIASKENYIQPFTYRVIKKPLHSSGLIELAVCGEGNLSSQKITKKDKINYQFAKKIKWGDGI